MVEPELERKNQATKYGNEQRRLPQLVVAKIPNYHAWCFHNFFHNFLRFFLTCYKSRL